MSDLSMSQFATKEDFKKALMEEGVTNVVAEPGRLVATRLVCGVELRMIEEGKHWQLSAHKK